jgi:hypothetical protein
MTDGPSNHEDSSLPPELFIRIPAPVYSDISEVLNDVLVNSESLFCKRQGEFQLPPADPLLTDVHIGLVAKNSMEEGRLFGVYGDFGLKLGLMDTVVEHTDEFVTLMKQKLEKKGFTIKDGQDARCRYIFCSHPDQADFPVSIELPNSIAGIVMEADAQQKDKIRFHSSILKISGTNMSPEVLKSRMVPVIDVLNSFYLSLYEALGKKAQFLPLAINTE